MPKTLTEIKPSSGTQRKTPKAASNGAKIPVRDTLPDETDPELLRANRLLVKVATAIRESREREQEQQKQGEA